MNIFIAPVASQVFLMQIIMKEVICKFGKSSMLTIFMNNYLFMYYACITPMLLSVVSNCTFLSKWSPAK